MPASAHASTGSSHVPCSEHARAIVPLLLGYFDAHATSAVSPANVAAHCTPLADSAVHCRRTARHAHTPRLPHCCVGSSHVPCSEQCTCSEPSQPSEHAASTVASNSDSSTATPWIVASGQPDTTSPQRPHPHLLQSSSISPQVKPALHSTKAVPLCPLGQSRSKMPGLLSGRWYTPDGVVTSSAAHCDRSSTQCPPPRLRQVFMGACHAPSDPHRRMMLPTKPSPHNSVTASSGLVSGYTTPSTRSAGHLMVSTPHAPAPRPLHCEITADHSPVFKHARYIEPGCDCPHDLVRTILAGVSGQPSPLLHNRPSVCHLLYQFPPHDTLISSHVPSALHALRAGPLIPAGHSTCASLSAGVAGQLR